MNRLRREDRIDEIGEVLAAVAATSAAAVDAACAPGSGVPAYAQGRVVGPYLRAVEGLAQHVRPDPTDKWDTFERGMAAMLADEESRAARHRAEHGIDSSPLRPSMSTPRPRCGRTLPCWLRSRTCSTGGGRVTRSRSSTIPTPTSATERLSTLTADPE